MTGCKSDHSNVIRGGPISENDEKMLQPAIMIIGITLLKFNKINNKEHVTVITLLEKR